MLPGGLGLFSCL
jgi:hypothetical protein